MLSSRRYKKIPPMSRVTGSGLGLTYFGKRAFDLYVIAMSTKPEVNPFRTENGEYGSVGPF